MARRCRGTVGEEVEIVVLDILRRNPPVPRRMSMPVEVFSVEMAAVGITAFDGRPAIGGRCWKCAKPRRQKLQFVHDRRAPRLVLYRDMTDFREQLFIDMIERGIERADERLLFLSILRNPAMHFGEFF